jgi:signal transduction histidine kinase
MRPENPTSAGGGGVQKQKDLAQGSHDLPAFPDRLLSAVVDQYRFSTLGTLVKGVTHNLNGGLQILSMRIELLQRILRQGKTENSSEIEEQVGQCLFQIDQFRGLIEGLIRQGLQEEQDGPEPIQINDLLEEELALFHHNLFFKHQVRVQKSFSPSLPPLRGNPGSISQGFWNLIQNAVEAMEATPKKGLTLITAMKEGGVQVTIQDTGCGIPVDVRPRLFEPLVTSKGGKHHGLGLFVAQALLKPLGAIFSYHSQEGETAFTVHFPVPAVLARGN